MTDDNVIQLGSKSKKPSEQVFMAYVMCLACLRRWVKTVSAKTHPFRIPCPSCKTADSYMTILPNTYVRALNCIEVPPDPPKGSV